MCVSTCICVYTIHGCRHPLGGLECISCKQRGTTGTATVFSEKELPLYTSTNNSQNQSEPFPKSLLILYSISISKLCQCEITLASHFNMYSMVTRETDHLFKKNFWTCRTACWILVPGPQIKPAPLCIGSVEF